MDRISRARWVVWSTALLLAGITALVIVDSALDVSRAKHAVATPMSAPELKAEGDRRLAAGDFAGALQAYDYALTLDASDLDLYYRAGVALSHLGDREQAATLFLRVVRQGPAEHADVRRAQEWLEAAGVLPPSERAAVPSP
jgi:tetratricopeptide (TPR) repeat protein